MQSENNPKPVNSGIANTASEESLDVTLDWLLDQDLAEPDETLFAVDTEQFIDQELSETEAAMAARPMFGGNQQADSLEGFVEEEIVLSSVGETSDIYQAPEEPKAHRGQLDTVAVVINPNAQAKTSSPSLELDEGLDILGLDDNDDIGDKPLVIKRSARSVNPTTPRSNVPVQTGEAEEKSAVNEDQADIPVPLNASANATTEAVEQQNEDIAIEADDREVSGELTMAEALHLDAVVTGPSDDAYMTETTEIASLDLAAQAAELTSEALEPEQANVGDESGATDVSEGKIAEETALPPAAEAADPTLIENTNPLGSEQEDDVLAYVASQPLPSDEAEFDQFLLRGEHLADIGSDMGELTVQPTEGVAPVDPEVSRDIDYHDDFAASDVFNAEAISAITEVIAAIMEQLTEMAEARLESLSYTSTDLQLDVMLGTDTSSVNECVESGFAPITQIISTLPTAIDNLGQQEIDAIYVRIVNGAGRDSWNDLFDDDFPANPDTEARLLLEQIPQQDNGGPLQESAPLSEESGQSFDPLALESEDQDLKLGFETPPVDQFHESDNFDFLSSEENGQVEALEAELDTVWQDMQADESQREETDTPIEVFDEDLFSPDAMEALDEISGEQPADLDTLFKGLGENPTDIDEVCGIAFDDFEVDNVAPNEPAEPIEQVQEEEALQPVVSSPLPEEPSGPWFMPPGVEFTYASQSTSEVFQDFLDAFIEEGALELEKLEDAISEWEKDVASDEAFAPVSRILHTLKGIAKGVGLHRYGTLIHNFETLLEKMSAPNSAESSSYFRVVNFWLDAALTGFEKIEETRHDITSEVPEAGPAESAVLPVTETQENAQLLSTEASTEPEDVEQPTAPISTSRSNDKRLADEGVKALAAQQTIRMTPDAVDHLMNLTNQAQQLGVRSSQGTVRGKLATAELQGRLSSIRSHIAKIADRSLLNVKAQAGQVVGEMDALEMDQYSELQEAANILREGVEDLGDLIQLCSRQSVMVEALLKQQASVISSLRSSIQGARVIPVSRLMPGLRRIVRTVGAELGKAVNFRVLNEVGSLDRDNFNRCQIILEHMVRNALDHGIESPDERVVAGKQMTGRITVDVSKEGSDYVITLADDGRGIDPDVMREVAFDKGLDLDIANLSDEEAQKLIFHKGFSTAAELSEISGRGVGMDIVFSELQQIGGDIDISSAVGQGTTFRIRVPSNVTVNGALLVNAGTSSYAVPLDGLVAVEHVPTDLFFGSLESAEPLALYGMECEAAYLGTLCGGENIPARKNWGDTVPVIIAGDEDRFMAIAIDGLEQALELVIRSLGNQFSSVPGIAGGATTADGQAVVALDLNALVASVDVDGAGMFQADADRVQENMLVMVVDDSRTQRMVATSQFDALGVETVTAENGLVAIEQLNAAHKLPEVILLDIEMPIKDGIQTLREIRKSAKFGHLPVIMVTSRTGSKHRNLAEQAGCSGFMGKPFNFPLLVQDINRLTGRQLELA